MRNDCVERIFYEDVRSGRESYWRRKEIGEEWKRRKGGLKKGFEGFIGFEKLRGTIRKLMDGKVAGIDEIPKEVWKYGGVKMVKVWKGGYGNFATGSGKGRDGHSVGRREW